MDFNSTIDIIIKDLDDARAIIDDLKKYEGVPILQVELAKSKCKSAADIIALLKTMNDIVPAAKEVPTQLQPQLQSKPKPQPEPQPEPVHEPQPQPEPVHEPQPQPKPK